MEKSKKNSAIITLSWILLIALISLFFIDNAFAYESDDFESPTINIDPPIPDLSKLDVYHVPEVFEAAREVGANHRAAYVDGYGLVRVRAEGSIGMDVWSEVTGANVPNEIRQAILDTIPVNSLWQDNGGTAQVLTWIADSPLFTFDDTPRLPSVGLADMQAAGDYLKQNPHMMPKIFTPGSTFAYMLSQGTSTTPSENTAALGYSYNPKTNLFERKP